MLSESHDLAQQSQLHIKDNGKFFSRLLSKETSVANPSFRVYYGGASGAIPFMWESQPGTPKHTFSEASIPPLTPPPSYYSNPTSKSKKKNSKPKLLYTIFPKLTPRKALVSPSSSLSSMSSSSLSSWSSSTYSSSPSYMKSKYHHGSSSPTSTLCFSAKHKTSNAFKGCYPIWKMKNAFLSIVGHGSSQGTT